MLADVAIFIRTRDVVPFAVGGVHLHAVLINTIGRLALRPVEVLHWALIRPDEAPCNCLAVIASQTM